MNRRRCNFQR